VLFLPDLGENQTVLKIFIKNTKFHRIRHLTVMPFHAEADVAKLIVAYETALRMLVMMIMMIGMIIF
jgi:hypothetical protein